MSESTSLSNGAFCSSLEVEIVDVVNEKIGIKSELDAAVFGVVLAVLPVTIAAPAVAISSAVLASPVVVVHKEAIEVATRESLALKLRACRFFRMFRAISCTDEIFVFTLGTSTATWRGMTGGGKIFKKVQESNQRHAAGGHLYKAFEKHNLRTRNLSYFLWR